MEATGTDVHDLPRATEVLTDSSRDHQRVRRQEDEEDRREDRHRFLHAAKIEEDEDQDARELDVQLEGNAGDRLIRPARSVRQHAEDRITARRDGDGDGQHVVDDQRAAADHARPRPEPSPSIPVDFAS